MTRNKRSKGKKILIVSFIIMLILGLGAFAYFYRPVSQTSVAVQDQCYVTRSEVGTTTSFKCDGTKCDAKAYAYCDDKTEDESIVIFRTNANSLSDYGLKNGLTWIAINGLATSGNTFTTTSDLHVYCSATNTKYGTSGTKVNPPSGKSWVHNPGIFVYSGVLYVEYGTANTQVSGVQTTYRAYTICDSLTTLSSTTLQLAKSLSPVDPYKTNNQEVYSGTSSMYSCSQDILINNLKYTTIEYSNPTTPGTFSSDIIHLKKDDILSSPGAKIDWAVIDDSRACSASQCNTQKTGYYECSSGSCPQLSTTFISCATGEFCTQTASGAKCGAPFITNGLVTGGRVTGTPITFEYSIESATIKTVDVTWKLVDSRTKSTVIASNGPSTLTLPVTKKTITFPAQSLVGDYIIIVSKSSGGVTYTNEEYPFTIGSELKLNVLVPQSGMTGTLLLTNSEFYVDVLVTENGVSITDLSNIIFTPKMQYSDGTTATLTKPQHVITNTQNGDVYRYKFTVAKPGKFTFTARAEKYGVPSNEDSKSADIREQKIVVKYTNMDKLLSINPGIHTVTFETTAPDETPLDISYKVTVIEPGCATGSCDIDVSSKVTRVDKGKYKFDYDFKVGTNYVQVIATANGYSGETLVKSAAISVQPGTPIKECTKNNDCVAGKSCVNYKCVEDDPPILLYIIISVLVIIVISIVFVVIKLARKKTSPTIAPGSGGFY